MSAVLDGLFSRRFGAGAEPALLLHCGLGSSSMWKGVAAGLGDHLSMLAPDLPGHGQSPDFAPRDLPKDVHDQSIDAIRPLLTGPMHLVGHSFSGTLALRMALEMPEAVLSLTLIEPVLFAAAEGHDSYAAQRAADDAVFAAYQSGDAMATARGFNATWGGGVPFDSFPEAIRQRMARQMGFVARSQPILWDDSKGLLRPGGLEGIKIPCLLLRGAQTVPIVADVHAALMARLSDASEEVIAGAGHMLVASHAPDVVQAMRHRFGWG